MDNNPFASVVRNLKNDNKTLAAYRIGTVVTVSPLVVEVAGINQSTDALMKNKELASFLVGDILLLIPIEDEQRYIIICRVVDA